MDRKWGGLVRDAQYNPEECPRVDCGSPFGALRDAGMAKALHGGLGALPTYADFYTYLDSVFQCIWAARQSWEKGLNGPLAGHIDDAETAMQRLDDFMYEQLGKGDL